MVFNTKRCSMQREEFCLREAGQVMQETEYSVPSERLAGNICPSRAYAGPRLCRGPDLKTTGKAGECLCNAFASIRARRAAGSDSLKTGKLSPGRQASPFRAAEQGR